MNFYKNFGKLDFRNDFNFFINLIIKNLKKILKTEIKIKFPFSIKIFF